MRWESVLSSAQLTLSARMESPPDVAALAWEEGVLVKTWAQRGTLHLHRTDELPLWVGAQAAVKPRYEQRTCYGDLLKPIAFRGDLIFTADTRFTLPPPFEALDPEVATKEVARRFLTRYGPATREDLAKWFGHPSAPQAGK